MKKLILLSLFAVGLSYAATTDVQGGGVIYDDTTTQSEESVAKDSARSVYMKAGMWSLIAGLIVRFYPHYTIREICEGMYKLVFPRDKDSEFSHVKALWNLVDEDLLHPKIGCPDRLLIMLPLAFFGTYYVSAKTIQSLRDAYDVYTKQNPQDESFETEDA